MVVNVLNEFNLNNALLGMALSYWDGAEPLETWWTQERYDKAFKRSKKLAFMQGGHNKFLESIVVVLQVNATRAFWSEMDTYRVGMTKQSASTMHTLSKRKLTLEDFSTTTDKWMIDWFNQILDVTKDVNILKANLPEGFLQTRIITTNYKTLQNIVWQREKHRLKEWRVFVEQLMAQVEFPYYLNQEDVV